MLLLDYINVSSGVVEDIAATKLNMPVAHEASFILHDVGLRQLIALGEI